MRLPEFPQIEHLMESKGTLQVSHQKISLPPGSKVFPLSSLFTALTLSPRSLVDCLETACPGMDCLGLILMNYHWRCRLGYLTFGDETERKQTADPPDRP